MGLLGRWVKRSVGHLLGIIGALFLFLAGLAALLPQIGPALAGRMATWAAGDTTAAILFALAVGTLIFVGRGNSFWRATRTFTSGIALVVIGVLALVLPNPELSLLALVGGALAILSGILYLWVPFSKVFRGLPYV